MDNDTGDETESTGDRKGNPFGAFSWEIYHQAGVAETCLALQAREGLDVNLLLFCVWAGRCGHTLSTAQIESLEAQTTPWQDAVVVPLRSVRTWLKHNVAGTDGAAASALREAVKAAELDAERLEQENLYRALPLSEGTADMEAMVSNVLSYFAVRGRTPGPEDTADLVRVLLAGLPHNVRALDLVRRFEDECAGG